MATRSIPRRNVPEDLPFQSNVENYKDYPTVKIGLIGLIIFVGVLFVNEPDAKVRVVSAVGILTCTMLFMYACHLCVRICSLPKEIMRCSKTWYGVWQRTMSLNGTSWGLLCLVVLSGVYCLIQAPHVFSIARYGPVPVVLFLLASFLTTQATGLEECTTWEVEMMHRLHGLDYGSSMAVSFYHGYLRIIIPAKGNTLEKNLKQRIHEFMDKNQITDDEFPVKTLVVLIPQSGSCPSLLNYDTRLSGTEIEPCKALEDTLQNRAGTQRRVYRGGAYRITCRPRTVGGEPSFLYVVAEGATPVQTLGEALKSSSRSVGML